MRNNSQLSLSEQIEKTGNNFSDALMQFEQLSQKYEQLIKNDAEFIEAKQVYLQLKEVRVKLVEYENSRREQNYNAGMPGE